MSEPGEDRARTTHAHAPGMRIGALVLTIGGLVWWIAGATQLATYPLVIALGLIAAIPLLWYGRKLPDDGERELFHRNVRRYNLLNLGQLAAIVAVVLVCGPLVGVPWLIPGLIAIVMGIHFLPLGRWFAQPSYARMGLAVIVIGIVGLMLGVSTASVPRTLVIVAMLVAVTLWIVPTVVMLGRFRSDRGPVRAFHLSDLDGRAEDLGEDDDEEAGDWDDDESDPQADVVGDEPDQRR